MSALTSISYGIERSFFEGLIENLNTKTAKLAQDHSAEKICYLGSTALTIVQTIDLSNKASKVFKAGSFFSGRSKNFFSHAATAYLVTRIFLESLILYGANSLNPNVAALTGRVVNVLRHCIPIANAVCVIASMNFPFIAGYFLHLALSNVKDNDPIKPICETISHALAVISIIMHGGFLSRILPAKY